MLQRRWPRRCCELVARNHILVSRSRHHSRCFHAVGSGKHTAHDRRSERRSEDDYWCTAVNRVCVPGTPPNSNVRGTRSLSATVGTVTLNWYTPTRLGASPEYSNVAGV